MENITLRKDSWRGMDTVVVFFNENITKEERYQVLDRAREYGRTVHDLNNLVGTHWGANYIELVYGTEEEYKKKINM